MELIVFLVVPAALFLLCRWGAKKLRANAADGKPKGWARAGEVLLNVIAVFIVLFFLALIGGGMGMTWFLQVPFLIAFGWIPFLLEKIPKIVFNWEGIAMAVAGLVFLVLGGHVFLEWLYAHWGGAAGGKPSPGRQWQARWTAGVVILLFLMFGASIGAIGAAHQTAWMLTDDAPFLKSSWRYGIRAYNSSAKANLHNLYLACKAYWAEQGSEKNCTVETAKGPAYGYMQPKEVVIEGGGDEASFHAVAGHLKGGTWWWVDPNGNVQELLEARPSTKPQ